MPAQSSNRSKASPSLSPRRLRSDSLIPGWLWLPAVIGIVFLLLPIIGMLTRVDPQSLLAVITAEESRLAMKLSLLTSVISALVSVALGFPLGYLLATKDFRGQRIVRTLILLPLVLPPVVSGLALLYTWGRSAVLGGAAEDLGLSLAYTTSAVIMAQIFVSLPFMVMSVETATTALGRRFELTAAELGAKPDRVFFTVTLPLLRNGITTGAVLCFARSLGEFGATLTFAGSLSGVTRTMPLQIYLVRESDPQAAIGLSLLLIVIAVVIIVLAYRSPHAPRLRPTPRTVKSTLAEAATPPPRHDRAQGAPITSGPPSGGRLSTAVELAERGIALDFTVPVGGTTAIIGRNGAGKSSLFHILTGALRPDSGHLRIGDDAIFDLDAGHWPAIHDRGIIHLAQNPLLFPHLSVIDNASYGLRAHGRPGNGRWTCSTASASVTVRNGDPKRSRAARPHASLWPAPSSSIRGCFCSTSPLPHSTSMCASRPVRWSPNSWPIAAHCSSLMTSTTSARWPMSSCSSKTERWNCRPR